MCTEKVNGLTHLELLLQINAICDFIHQMYLLGLGVVVPNDTYKVSGDDVPPFDSVLRV